MEINNNTNELKELLEEIEFYQNSLTEDDYDVFDKLHGDLDAGSKIEIYWEDRDEFDEGYIFYLPNQNTDEYDCCVHVTNPDNSDGIGESGYEVWKHLYNIASLERVCKIEVL